MGIDLLLEGFTAEQLDPVPASRGKFTVGDQVHVSVPGGQPIAGKVRRAHTASPDTHVVVAPEGGGAHVVAPIGDVRLNTPAQHAAAAKRAAQAAARDTQQQQQGQQPVPVVVTKGAAGKPVPGKPAAAGKPAAVQESARAGVGILLEAFTAPAPSSAAASPTAAAASSSVGAWSASKHPRAGGGKFGYTTGGKRATRSPAAKQRTLGVGANGALVKAIQRQVGTPADGKYGPNTKAAVERYQRQHGLQVDGVVGAQTIAALSGNPHPARVKPGPITAKAATVRLHKSHRTSRKAPINRTAGGMIV